jgi:preprotein translocase subunit SecG
METIVLVIHLILALTIIGLVLMQRSSGGGLGIGGGGAGDFATARSTATALTRMTTYFAIAFFGTSLTLAYLAANQSQTSILDNLETPAISTEIEAGNFPIADDEAADAEQEIESEPTVPTGQ